MHRSVFLYLLFSIGTLSFGWAQTSKVAQVKDNYGIDFKNKIIVCHTVLMDSVSQNLKTTNSFSLDKTSFSFIDAPILLQSTDRYLVVNVRDTFQLYFTQLPIIKLTPSDSIVNEPKRMARMSYADSTSSFKAAIGIEWRGNSALNYPKKSYDLEIRVESTSEVSRNLQFGPLRNDDDWLLNSLYNEPLKLRTYFSTKLWLDLHAPSYLSEEPKAKSSNDLVFAEVFLDESYVGVYMLSEPVDRKQLQLQKMKNDTVHGTLYKANRYLDATTFKNAPTFNNAFPDWAGFQMKYPYENFNAHWEELYPLIALAAGEDDKDFVKKIEKHLDLDNAIDYFIFVNLLRATDNLGKNYYLAKNTEEAPYFFVPWDLDGVLGCIQDAKTLATTNDILSNGLFDRLLATNPASFRGRLKARWEQLRSDICSDEVLFGRLNKIYNFLDSQRIYERDNLVWPRVNDAEADFVYTKEWLEKRLKFMDLLFSSFE
jgi:hypothetical protein